MADADIPTDAAQRLLAEHDALVRAVVGWGKWRFRPETREDVAQRIRLELHARPGALLQADDPALWVKRICIRRCIDEVRREIRDRTVFAPASGEHPDTADGGGDPHALVVRAERARALRRVLEALDDTCRTALRMFYIEHQSYLDMARALGIATNTVGSRLAKCIAKLRSLARQDTELGEYFR